jgi:hypothetical protein
MKNELAITQTHINTLQSIIARCSNYSANCKTWTITIVSALLVILFDNENIDYKLLLVPVILFWILDCYYLSLEKSFRKIYDEFISSLDTDSPLNNDLKISIKGKRISNFIKSIFSISTTPMYLVVLALIIYIKK